MENTQSINDVNIAFDQQQQDEKIYTPSAIWDAIKNKATDLLQEAKTQIVTTAGILTGKPNGQAYNNYKYLTLKDELGAAITLRVHTSMYDELIQYLGKKVKLQGIFYISVNVQVSKIDIVFNVHKILGRFVSDKLDKAQIERAEKTQKIFDKKFQRNYDVRNILMNILNKNQKPSVVFIIGTTGIVDKDVISAMKGTEEYYDIKVIRTNLTDKDSILSTAFEAIEENNCDVLCIVRGGGDGLQVFDDSDFVIQILDIDKPLISAVGHAQDVTLFEQAADKGFETPTALGVFFKEIAENYKYLHHAKEMEEKLYQLGEQHRNAMATIKEIQQAKEMIKQEMQKLQRERDNLARRMQKFKIAFIVAGIAVLVLLVIILGMRVHM